jgi:hypothetical protein
MQNQFIGFFGTQSIRKDLQLCEKLSKLPFQKISNG